jgi:hypothetical protein
MIEDVNNFGILTSDEEKAARQQLCDACSLNELVSDNQTCQKCACPITYVVKYRFKICPMDKWAI